jgi:hypothetical protein
MWTLKALINHCNTTQAEVNEKWVPARPLVYRSFWERLSRAWAVFRERADCFTWPENQ